MGKRTKCFRECYVTTAGYDKDWNNSNMGSRISAGGGYHQGNKITNKTTHLAVTPKQWKAQGHVVKEALEINRDSKRDIKIVSFDWLDDVFQNQKSKPEGPYMWEKLAPKHNGDESKNNDSSKKRKKANAKQTDAVDGPKSHVGMMAEVFQESTEKFVDAKERKRLQRQIEHANRVRKDLEREEQEAKQKAERDAKRAAAAFQRGAKKARNQIFSENHHIYADDTGFKYDVLLTKVDTKHNKNERWALTLQIYESNAEPYTYAMNAQFAGTGTRTENNVLAALGTSFITASHVFKETFKEKTGIKWDERVSFALERGKREKRNRGYGTGSDAGTQKGVPVSENGAAKGGALEEEDFATAPFQYHPPAYGPRGDLPESEMEKLQLLVQPAEANKGKGKAIDQEKVDLWMSGGNGAAPASDTVDLSYDAGNPADTNDSLEEDMAKIFSGLNGESGNVNTVDPDSMLESNRAADSVFQHSDNHLGDFGDPNEFPFGNDEFFMSDLLTDQNDTSQHISFDNVTGIQDSFAPGSQLVGETQLAERAQGEFMEYLNKPQYHGGIEEPVGEGYDSSNLPIDGGADIDKRGMKNGGTDKPTSGELCNFAKEKPMNFGSSILGKRKTLPADALSRAKKKPAEIPDSFDGQSYDQVSPHDHGEDEVNASSFVEESGVAATEQPPPIEMEA